MDEREVVARARDAGRERCPYCRDALDADAAGGFECPGCATRVHADCRREAGRCTTAGCTGPPPRRAAAARTGPRPARGGRASAPRCRHCLAELRSFGSWRCPACSAEVHDDCWSREGRCPTPGCTAPGPAPPPAGPGGSGRASSERAAAWERAFADRVVPDEERAARLEEAHAALVRSRGRQEPGPPWWVWAGIATPLLCNAGYYLAKGLSTDPADDTLLTIAGGLAALAAPLLGAGLWTHLTRARGPSG